MTLGSSFKGPRAPTRLVRRKQGENRGDPLFYWVSRLEVLEWRRPAESSAPRHHGFSGGASDQPDSPLDVQHQVPDGKAGALSEHPAIAYIKWWWCEARTAGHLDIEAMSPSDNLELYHLRSMLFDQVQTTRPLAAGCQSSIEGTVGSILHAPEQN